MKKNMDEGVVVTNFFLNILLEVFAMKKPLNMVISMSY